MPSIKVVPQFAVIDDEIDVTVCDLEPNSATTIDASIIYYKSLYVAFGHFYSDSNGCINLKHHVSYGGTYSGLQPMGLFNSMRAMPSKHGCPRLLVKASAEEILKYKISVWKSHLTQDQVHQLHIKYTLFGTSFFNDDSLQKYAICQCDIKRTYLSPNVHRIPIKINFKEEIISGVLFLPKGKGPFPGVIDLFGGAGGCIEIRAALLAKHGFAALALAYFAHDGLKAKSYGEFEMVYFDKAIEWFAHHPKVAPGGISMVGVCLGAQVILLSVIRNASVRSAVCINSNMFMSTNPNLTNPLMDAMLSSEVSSLNLCEVWRGQLSANLHNPMKIPRPILHYNHDNPILFMIGEHDLYPKCVDDAIDQLKKSGKKNLFKRIILGQGHLIEPPYMPLCTASPSPTSSTNDEEEELLNYLPYDWNGDYKNHGNSQIEAWKILLDFLHQNSAIPATSSKL